MKGTVQQKDKSIETKEIEDIDQVIADIKITKTVKAEQGDLSHKIVNTNKVEETYRKLLLEMKKSFEKYLR